MRWHVLRDRKNTHLHTCEQIGVMQKEKETQNRKSWWAFKRKFKGRRRNSKKFLVCTPKCGKQIQSNRSRTTLSSLFTIDLQCAYVYSYTKSYNLAVFYTSIVCSNHNTPHSEWHSKEEQPNNIEDFLDFSWFALVPIFDWSVSSNTSHVIFHAIISFCLSLQSNDLFLALWTEQQMTRFFLHIENGLNEMNTESYPTEYFYEIQFDQRKNNQIFCVRMRAMETATISISVHAASNQVRQQKREIIVDRGNLCLNTSCMIAFPSNLYALEIIFDGWRRLWSGHFVVRAPALLCVSINCCLAQLYSHSVNFSIISIAAETFLINRELGLLNCLPQIDSTIEIAE